VLEALKSIAAKGDLFSQCEEGKEENVGQQPRPCRRSEDQHDGDSAAQDQGKNADDGQSPAEGQPQSGLARRASARRQSLRAERMPLAIEDEPHAGIAHQQQKQQHGLLGQRSPLFAVEPQRFVPGQRPGYKKPEDGGDESKISAEAATCGG